MDIRQLSAEDAEIFQALRLFALQESTTAFGSSFEEERDRSHVQIASFLTGSRERLTLGAFVNQQLAGIVRIGRETSLKERHRGFIRSMYVLPQHRGLGIGTVLLQEALNIAATWRGLQQLTLTVTAGNESAIAVYSKVGFIECGRAPSALYVEGVYYDEIQMVKQNGAV